jgi:hypothetical protein
VDDSEDIIDLTESSEVRHIQLLREFKEKLWPYYEPYMSFGEAFIIFELNALNNTVNDLIDELKDRSF